MSLWREGRAYEIFGYLLVFVTTEQDTISKVQCPPCTSYLLIVMNRRTGSLIVDNEAQIRLIEAHTEGCGCN